MIIEHIDERTVCSALELAARAPSAHNSQPWVWRYNDRTVRLYADFGRRLPGTDANGRDLILSCGAALHHLRVALAASGIAASIRRMPDVNAPEHLASLYLSPHRASRRAAKAQVREAEMITRRRTDRRRYGDWPVPEVFLEELQESAANEGAVLQVVDDQSGGRTFDNDALSVDQRAGHDGAMLLVLSTTSDDQLSQLRAGEALSAVLLHATDVSLATCALTQPLEVESTYSAIRNDLLGGRLAPQVLLRVGWRSQEPLPPTPRRPRDQIVEPIRT
jgi:nitroreductase